jgi:hypothetical protein
MNLCPVCLKTFTGDLDAHKCKTKPETKPVNKDLAKQVERPEPGFGEIEHK